MLRVQGLESRYGPITAVRDVSLEVREGELVALIGANGAGKSTTLASIAGVVKPSRGRIMFFDEPITGRAPEEIARLGVAMVPENRGIFPSLTVVENLRLGAYLRRDPVAVQKDLELLFERFPILADRRTQRAGTLSGGEQQQLAIGRALLSRPRLLMLDEPSLGLAPALVDRMFHLVKQLSDQGVTVLLVEQNVTRTLEIAHRVYLMRTGRVEVSGTPDEVRAQVDIAGVYLGGRSAGAV
ncbi:MAG: ABC transporter ATP-binding protein [Chloroflexota bacterium]